MAMPTTPSQTADVTLTVEPSEYKYTPLNKKRSQFRLLTLPFTYLGIEEKKALRGTLTNHDLPSVDLSRRGRLWKSARLPVFRALSYAWGDATLSHEILIDGKRLRITANLHNALKDLQKSAIMTCRLWADAICINQEDLDERSSQIYLMRQIFRAAADVCIWLGPNTKESLQCFAYMALLKGLASPFEEDEYISPGQQRVEAIMTATMQPPLELFMTSLFAFAAMLTATVDILSGSTRDDQAQLVQVPNGRLSQLQEVIPEFATWRPRPARLEAASSAGSFSEMARLIDTFITNSTWFERMWVVQEVGVADTISIELGGYTLTWKDFLRLIHYLHFHCEAPVAGIWKVIGIEKIRRGYSDGKRYSLRDLIWETRYRKASDPRDKAYSLLGLMGDDRGNKLLTPDYNRPVAEVYADVTRYFISQSQNLNPICGQQIEGRQKDLPSWVLDFTLDGDDAAAPLIPIIGEELFHASGYDWRSEYLFAEAQGMEQSWSCLPAHGFCLGVVAQLSESSLPDESLELIERRWSSLLAAHGDMLKLFTNDTKTALADLSEVVSKYSNSWHSTHLDSETASSTWKSTLDDTVIAYIHTVFSGRISPRERLTDDDVTAFLTVCPPPKAPALSGISQPDFIKKVCAALDAGLRRKKMFITHSGYLGTGLAYMEVGDLVCVIHGCNVPLVLRTRPGEDLYRLVGESYLHGFMDAEAIALNLRGDLEVQQFVLS